MRREYLAAFAHLLHRTGHNGVRLDAEERAVLQLLGPDGNLVAGQNGTVVLVACCPAVLVVVEHLTPFRKARTDFLSAFFSQELSSVSTSSFLRFATSSSLTLG